MLFFENCLSVSSEGSTVRPQLAFNPPIHLTHERERPYDASHKMRNEMEEEEDDDDEGDGGREGGRC